MQHHAGKHDGAANECGHGRQFAHHHPGPNWAHDGFNQGEQRDFGRRNVSGSPGDEGEPKPNLNNAQQQGIDVIHRRDDQRWCHEATEAGGKEPAQAGCRQHVAVACEPAQNDENRKGENGAKGEYVPQQAPSRNRTCEHDRNADQGKQQDQQGSEREAFAQHRPGDRRGDQRSHADHKNGVRHSGVEQRKQIEAEAAPNRHRHGQTNRRERVFDHVHGTPAILSDNQQQQREGERA